MQDKCEEKGTFVVIPSLCHDRAETGDYVESWCWWREDKMDTDRSNTDNLNEEKTTARSQLQSSEEDEVQKVCILCGTNCGRLYHLQA